LEEKTVVVLDNGKVTGKSVSELLRITHARVKGIAKDMPVVGRWKSKDGDVFYFALGVIVDKAGEPIWEKPSKRPSASHRCPCSAPRHRLGFHSPKRIRNGWLLPFNLMNGTFRSSGVASVLAETRP
jgi:hypothetical protein